MAIDKNRQKKDRVGERGRRARNNQRHQDNQKSQSQRKGSLRKTDPPCTEAMFLVQLQALRARVGWEEATEALAHACSQTHLHVIYLYIIDAVPFRIQEKDK